MSPKAIGCWTKLECLRPSIESRRKCNNNLAIFFLLVPSERTMHLCRRNAEQKDENPSKSRYFRHVNQDQHVSQIHLHPSAPQKYAPKVLPCTRFLRRACLLQKFGAHDVAFSHRFHSVHMVPDMACSTEPDRPCLLRLPCSWFC
jgi:hypothetical protein